MKAKMVLVIALTFVSVLNAQSQTKNHTGKAVSHCSPYKKYVNEKLGLAFKYPGNWIESGKIAEVVDLNGVTKNLTVTFIDRTKNLSFTLEYYLPPMGKKLYEDALAQYKSSQGWYANDSKEMTVAGKKAIVANILTTVDGKEHLLNKPLRKIIVMFLDMQETGAITLQLSADANLDNEVKNFNTVLSSFKFINKS